MVKDVEAADEKYPYGKLIACPICTQGKQAQWLRRHCGLEGRMLDIRIADWGPGGWADGTRIKQREEALTAMQYYIAKPEGLLTLYGDFGCLAKDVLIFDPLTNGHTPVEEINGEHHVLAWNGRRFIATTALRPYIKGHDMIYRVTTKAGREINVTRDHAFLTPSGYIALSELSCGHHIAAIPDRLLSTLISNVHHCSRTASDYQDGYWLYRNQRDEQPRRREEIALNTRPLQDDALSHSQHGLSCNKKDGRAAREPTHSRPCLSDIHQPKQDLKGHAALPVSRQSLSRVVSSNAIEMLFSLRNQAALLFERNLSPFPQIDSESHLRMDQRQTFSFSHAYDVISQLRRVSFLSDTSIPAIHQNDWQPESKNHNALQALQAAPWLPLCHPSSDALFWSSLKISQECNVCWDSISSIEEVSTQPFYDFHVPVYNNYVANGIVNHNSGKSTALAIICNEIREQMIDTLYAPLSKVLDHLRSLIGQNADSSPYWERLLNVPVLALDEVTRFNATNWAEEKVFLLVDTRYQRRDTHLTIFATNDDPKKELPHNEAMGYLLSRMREGDMLELRGDMRPGVQQKWRM